MDMRNNFFNYYIKATEKPMILEHSEENKEQSEPSYPTYSKEEVKKLVNTRKISQIKEIFGTLKAKIRMNNRKTEDKNISERS